VGAVVPVVGHPEEAGDSEGEFEVAAHVVVVEGFVEPIPVPEDDTSHQYKSIMNIRIISIDQQVAWARINQRLISFFACLNLLIAFRLFAIASDTFFCSSTVLFDEGGDFNSQDCFMLPYTVGFARTSFSLMNRRYVACMLLFFGLVIFYR
jgi:hypothetical protein